MSTMHRLLPALSLALMCVAPHTAAALVLSIDPHEVVVPGEVFIVPVRIDTEGACINTVRMDFSYTTDHLDIVEVARGRSILTLWTEEPQFDREAGSVTFSGGIPGGYCGRVVGDPGLTNIIAELVFRVQPTTEQLATSIRIDEAEVYGHDGQGTVLPARLESQAVPIDGLATTTPQDAWVARVKQDITAPELFEIILDTEPYVARGRYFIAFNTTDKQSGIAYYEVRETDPERWGFLSFVSREAQWITTKSPYVLRDQSLNSTIQVKAVDKAGNERVVSFQPPEELRRVFTFLDLVGWLILLVLLTACGFIALKLVRAYRREGARAEQEPFRSDPGESA